MILHCSEHMSADYLDRLWLDRTDAGPVGPHFVGYLGEDPPWPRDLGAEPNWWLTELGMLFDAWEDGSRFARDYREHVEDTYRRSKL